MQKKMIIALSMLMGIFVGLPLPLMSAIRVLCTATILNERAELRKIEYSNALSVLNELGYEPYIVESALEPESYTYLNDFSSHVYYSHTNDINAAHKGINESSSMLAALDHFNFDPDDMIIKLTGRYHFECDYFLKLVEEYPSIDLFIRWGGKPGDFITPDSVFTGCFAMRCSALKKMLLHEEYNALMALQPVEEVAGIYIKKYIPANTLMQVERLFVTAYIFGDGIDLRPLSQW